MVACGCLMQTMTSADHLALGIDCVCPSMVRQFLVFPNAAVAISREFTSSLLNSLGTKL